MIKERKTKEVTVTVPHNYDWDEELLQFREHIDVPTDNADLTNAKVGDVYETNLGEKAVLISTNGICGDFHYIFLVTSRYGGDRTFSFNKDGFYSEHYKKDLYIKEKLKNNKEDTIWLK